MKLELSKVQIQGLMQLVSRSQITGAEAMFVVEIGKLLSEALKEEDNLKHKNK